MDLVHLVEDLNLQVHQSLLIELTTSAVGGNFCLLSNKNKFSVIPQVRCKKGSVYYDLTPNLKNYLENVMWERVLASQKFSCLEDESRIDVGC